MNYILRHLELGGPVISNIENVRLSNGVSAFHGHSEGLTKKMMANWSVYLQGALSTMADSWDMADGPPVVVVDKRFRVLGLAKQGGSADNIVVPYVKA